MSGIVKVWSEKGEAKGDMASSGVARVGGVARKLYGEVGMWPMW